MGVNYSTKSLSQNKGIEISKYPRNVEYFKKLRWHRL
jgi:hypothetical protein